ncbi:MAG: glycosyltransferase family 4 protein [Pseudomonadales bacterium]
MANIIVISHTPTHPANAGNRARVNALLSSLQAAGHKISMFFLDSGDGDIKAMSNTWDDFWTHPYTSPRQNVDRKIRTRISRFLKIDLYKQYRIDDWWLEDINAKLCELNGSNSFDVVLVEYVFFSRVFESFPKALKVLDTHDAFGDRHKTFLKNGSHPSWFYTTPAEEQKGLMRADVVLAIQSREKSYFSSLVPDKKVLVVGHATSVSKKIYSNKPSNKLIFIGTENDINLHAISYFLENIWPSIQENVPDTRLDIVGAVGTRIGNLPTGCFAIGEVPNVGEWYDKADIAINPVQFGTGLKIKNIEALGHGMPLVTTTVGAEGIEYGSGSAFFVADSPDQFILQVCRLLENRILRENLSKFALNFAREYNHNAISPILKYIDHEFDSE